MRTGRSSSRSIAENGARLTGCGIFADVGSDASSFGESYEIHTLPQARVHFARRRDATRHSLRRNVTLASVQYPRSSSSSRAQSGLSLNRASRKIYLETVTIIRAVADACSSRRMRIVLCREDRFATVSRPFRATE